MINGDLASSILYTAAGALFVLAVAFAFVAWGMIHSHHGSFGSHEQMRERTPWPPPLQDSGWVEVVYDRQPRPQVRAQPMALPRGES